MIKKGIRFCTVVLRMKGEGVTFVWGLELLPVRLKYI